MCISNQIRHLITQIQGCYCRAFGKWG